MTGEVYLWVPWFAEFFFLTLVLQSLGSWEAGQGQEEILDSRGGQRTERCVGKTQGGHVSSGSALHAIMDYPRRFTCHIPFAVSHRSQSTC